MKIGFQKALSAILDGNITTLIAAAVFGCKGSGTVKGFAADTCNWYRLIHVYSTCYYKIDRKCILCTWT